MAKNFLSKLLENRWAKVAIFSLAGILVLGLLQLLIGRLIPSGGGPQGTQMGGMGMMGSGMGMMGSGMGMMGGSQATSGSLLGFFLNTLTILAVIALFAGLIGFVYKYVQKNILIKSETKTEIKDATKSETDDIIVQPKL